MKAAIRNRPALLGLTQLISHPNNVRNGVGPRDELEDLARSIREHGLLQPIVVSPTDREGRYLILAGHRRAQAAALAGMTQVPATIRSGVETDADEHLIVMLVENWQRRDLDPVEKAQAIGALSNHGLSQSEIARRTGIHAATVNYHLRLLDLDDETLEAVRDGKIALGDAHDAVIEARRELRANNGRPQRGRPTIVEPAHLDANHPLATAVRFRCTHTRRPKIGNPGIGCGQCWEAAIRADTLGEPQPVLAVDEVAVQRAVSGDRPAQLSKVDRLEAVRRMTEHGLSAQQIATLLHVTERQIVRDQRDVGAPSR